MRSHFLWILGHFLCWHFDSIHSLVPVPHNPEMLGPLVMENLNIPECLRDVDDAGHILHEYIVSATLVRNSQIMENFVRGDCGRVPGARDINSLTDGDPQQREQVQEVRYWIIIRQCL